MASHPLCEQHHKMMEKSSFFQVIGLILTIAAIAFGFGMFSFASADNVKAVQRQTDNQREEMRDLRKEMNTRFDKVDQKLDRLAQPK